MCKCIEQAYSFPQSKGKANGLLRRLVLAALAATFTLGAAVAQEVPTPWKASRPIRMIVPFPAGGGTDQVARLFAERIQARLGQTVVIENRSGANGIIGSQVAYTAPPDGLTLLVGTIDTQAINSSLYSNLQFHPAAFIPVAPIAALPMVFAVSKQGKVRKIADLIEVGKTGEGNYGHWGIGSISHLASELMKQQLNIPKLQGIPYQGSGPGMQALMAGQIDVMFLTLSLAQSAPDRLDILGIASAHRFQKAKDIPTMADIGFPVEADSWMGVFAPPKTPKPVVEAIFAAAMATVADPETTKRMLDIGVAPQQFASSEAYGKWVAAEQTRWSKVVRDLGVKPIRN
jgi:tripartite-type tricarboxylate transporter receptor subunit TctC